MKRMVTAQDLAEYTNHLATVVTHHGANLKGVWPHILAGAMRYADEPFTVGTWRSQLAPGAWVTIGGQRYRFGGERLAQHHYQITVKARGVQGAIVARFTDRMTPDEIDAVFKGLKARAVA